MNEKEHRIHLHQDQAGQWRYTVVAANGRVVDRSEEGFEHRSYAEERATERWPGAEVKVEERTVKP